MSLIFKNGSGTKNLNILSTNPIYIKISNSDKVYIQNISIAPSGGTLEKSIVKLSGNFEDSTIDVKTSTVIQAGDNFKVNNPITLNASTSDTIAVTGDFRQTPGVKLEKPCNIFASNANPPTGLILQIAPNNTIPPISLSGDFLNTKIVVENQTSLKCDGNINEFIVEKSANIVPLELVNQTAINNLKTSATLELTGEELALNQTIIHAIGIQYIIVKSIFKAIEFINGLGKISTQINTVGKYTLTLKAKLGDTSLEFNQKLPVQIIK